MNSYVPAMDGSDCFRSAAHPGPAVLMGAHFGDIEIAYKRVVYGDVSWPSRCSMLLAYSEDAVEWDDRKRIHRRRIKVTSLLNWQVGE